MDMPCPQVLKLTQKELQKYTCTVHVCDSITVYNCYMYTIYTKYMYFLSFMFFPIISDVI